MIILASLIILSIPMQGNTQTTETETKESIDSFAEALIKITKEAEETPDMVTNAPQTTSVKRLNDAYAARNLDISWYKKG